MSTTWAPNEMISAKIPMFTRKYHIFFSDFDLCRVVPPEVHGCSWWRIRWLTLVNIYLLVNIYWLLNWSISIDQSLHILIRDRSRFFPSLWDIKWRFFPQKSWEFPIDHPFFRMVKKTPGDQINGTPPYFIHGKIDGEDLNKTNPLIHKSHGNSWNFSRFFRRISRPPTPWSSSVATSSLASSPRAGSPRWRWRPCSSACGTSRRPGRQGGGHGMGLGGFPMGKPWENPWENPWHQKASFVGERGKSLSLVKSVLLERFEMIERHDAERDAYLLV